MSIVRGYEKFWNTLFGATMATAVTTFVLYGVAKWTGAFEPPSGEMLAAAVGALVGGLFNAINVYMTATTSPEADPVHPDDFTSTPKE